MYIFFKVYVNEYDMWFFFNEKNNCYVDVDIVRIEEINRCMYNLFYIVKLFKFFCVFVCSFFIFSLLILYLYVWFGYVKYLFILVVIDCLLYVV